MGQHHGRASAVLALNGRLIFGAHEYTQKRAFWLRRLLPDFKKDGTGLGIEAQRAAAAQATWGIQILSEFTEEESGKKNCLHATS